MAFRLPFALASALGVSGYRVRSANADARLSAEVSIRALHHNPHWECFDRDPGHCTTEHRKMLGALLHDHDVDFASLVMGGEYATPAGYEGEYGISGHDRAQLIWNATRWQKESARPAEFQFQRAGVVGRFAHRSIPGLKVVVASLHYPHVSWQDYTQPTPGKENVAKAIQDVQEGAAGVLVMADTNVPAADKTSAVLLNELGLGGAASLTTEALPTCCGDWRRLLQYQPDAKPFDLTFDRIFANFGESMATVEDEGYLELTANYTRTPWWARDVKKPNSDVTAAYHHVVMAELSVMPGSD